MPRVGRPGSSPGTGTSHAHATERGIRLHQAVTDGPCPGGERVSHAGDETAGAPLSENAEHADRAAPAKQGQASSPGRTGEAPGCGAGGSASALGAEGRRFKSCHPDTATASVMADTGVWLSRLERLADNEKSGGSSPSTPTSDPQAGSLYAPVV